MTKHVGDAPTEIEESRLREMCDLYLAGHTFSEMVPILNAAGLVRCPNCEDPKKKRTNRRGDLICTTCENTLSRFWKRNRGTLPVPEDEDDDLRQTKWEWRETQRFVLRACHKHFHRKVVTRTTKTERVAVEGKSGEFVDVTTVTEREEWRVDAGLLRLMSDTSDKIARVGGMDIDEPGDDDKVPQGKVMFELPDDSGEKWTEN